MPRRDGTGPMGMGSMTGRMNGACSDSGKSGFAKGFGIRSGFGCRMGRRGCAGLGYAGHEDRMEALKKEKEMLKERLGQIEKEIEE